MKDLKAPWRVDVEMSRNRFNPETGEPERPTHYFWIRNNDGETVELFSGMDENKAITANLFAASPELLDCLESLVCELEAHEIHAPARIAAAKAAVAKARGKVS